MLDFKIDTALEPWHVLKSMLQEEKRPYLRVGEKVYHLRHRAWGNGVVQETMTSILPGGTCLVRIKFDDGVSRTFENNLKNPACCYYFGLRVSREVNFLK
ncbi:MAG: hypothetical protein GXP49_04790 [Deltaproteobacteria bacterium]|nr:hypothetical protein [Deltaproteobacteria bacterium]